MKARILLWLSLGLNLVLVAAVCLFTLRRPAPQPVPREVRMTPMDSPAVSDNVQTSSSVTVSDPGMESFSWTRLASPDFKEYRDRLRAIGCPAETVRDILLAEIEEKFRQRRAETLADMQRRYWEVAARGEDGLEELRKPLQKLNAEQQALIEDVLGSDSKDEESQLERQTQSWERRYAWLPAEKQARLVELELQFQERNQAVWETARQHPDHELTVEENQKLRTLEEDLTAARKQLLSPEEFLEYRLRSSGAGTWARNLPGFETTETEWRAVAQLKLEHQEALNKSFPDKDEIAGTVEIRRQMQAELDAANKSTLGPERFAEYELAGSSDYQQTRKITERYHLPESLAKHTYELQRAAASQAQATRTDASLSVEARASALAAIRQETERTLATTLGPKVFNTYQEYHGNWLKQLDQAPEE